MTSESIYKPTWLYIKQHQVTGLKYFGKTTREPLKYSGSGTYWLRHIKKHGKELVDTVWAEKFNSKEELVEFALFFSDFHDIINSDKWANIIIENGMDGGSAGRIVTDETRRKISEGSKRRIITDETRRKISESNKGRKITAEEKERRDKYYAENKKPKKERERKGRACSEETKEKIAAKHRNKFVSSETKEKMRLAKIGKPKTEAHKEAMRLAHRRKKAII